MSEVGGRLAEALQARHYDVFGWDVQWMPADWTSLTSNETLASESAIEAQIAALIDTGRYCAPAAQGGFCKAPLRPGRVVLLTHDFLFEDGPRGRGEEMNMPRLIKLIKALKGRGYFFSTMDHYLD